MHSLNGVPLAPVHGPLNSTANGSIRYDNCTFSPIPVDQLGEYITHSHDNDDNDFKDQFKVIYAL